jgi:hypothetical protein
LLDAENRGWLQFVAPAIKLLKRFLLAPEQYPSMAGKIFCL